MNDPGVLYGVLSAIVLVAAYVWLGLSLSAVFTKAGEEGWKAWVPFLNLVVLVQLGELSGWLVLLVLVPVIGWLGLLVVLVIAFQRVNRSFGFGAGMTVLAVLLLPVWASVVGWGSARWLGSETYGPVRRGDAAPPLDARLAAPAPGVPPRPPAPGFAAPAPGFAAPAPGFAAPASGFGAPAFAPASAPAGPAPFAPSPQPAPSSLAPGPDAPAAPSFSAPAVPSPATAAVVLPPLPSAPPPAAAPAPHASVPASPAPFAAAVPVAAPETPALPFAAPAPPPGPVREDSAPRDAAREDAVPGDPARGDAARGDAVLGDAAPERLSDDAPVPAFRSSARAAAAAAERARADEIEPSDDDDEGLRLGRSHAPFTQTVPTSSPATADPPAPAAPRRAFSPEAGEAPSPVSSFAEAGAPDAGGLVPSPVAAGPGDPWAPPAATGPVPAVATRATRYSPPFDPDAHFETSAEVSAVVGAPVLGSPLSARESVSAQRTDPEIPNEAGFDETILAPRRRPAWVLTPPLGAPIAVTSTVLIVGRRPGGDAEFPNAQLIAVSDETRTMSKTHARLELHGDEWTIIDLDSTNGVVLMGEDGTERDATPFVAERLTERFLLGDAELRVAKKDA